MKTRTLFIALTGLGLTLGSCHKETVKPSSQVTTEVRNLTGFSRIDVEDALNVEIIHIPGSEQVVVETNANLHPYIITDVVSGTLFIHRKENVNIKPGATIAIYVTASELSGLEISGASIVQLMNQLTTSNLGLNISGASVMKGNINAATAQLDLSGASSVNLSGVAYSVDAELSGASTLNDFDFSIENLDINLSGASNASLTINGLINVTASGASSLNYKGDGLIEDLNLSGGSSVNKL
jgi:hypothetical protein